jgi:hypothetical protein
MAWRAFIQARPPPKSCRGARPLPPELFFHDSPNGFSLSYFK